MSITKAIARVDLLPVSAAQKRAIKPIVRKCLGLRARLNEVEAELDAQLLEVSKTVVHVDKSMMALEGRVRTVATPPATLRWALLTAASDAPLRELVPKGKAPSEAIAQLVKKRAELLADLRSVNRKLKEAQ